jgi:hypothetical protein
VGLIDEVARVAKKLDSVRDRRIGGFGADTHQFEALPPVAESVVSAFESRHSIALPGDYRLFVTTVSRGGIGPAYGLVPFEETPTFEREVSDTVVENPFPYTEAYNPYDDPRLVDYWRREASGQLQKGEYLRRKSSEVSGTLVLCHEGCGHLHLLVVHGPDHGRMWIDSTVSDGGYAPLGVGFLGWYERWLDDLLAGHDGNWWNHGAA